ncbi:MAG: ATP-binding protein [Elusimicrobiota bacterium]
MNVFSLSGLLIVVSSSLMGIFVLCKGRNVKSNLIWVFFVFAVAIWGAGLFFIGFNQDSQKGILLWRLTRIGTIFIPVLFFHYTHSYLNLNRTDFLALVYILGIFFLIADFTPLFIYHMSYASSSLHRDSPPGIIYQLFLVFFAAVIIYTHYEFFKALREASGLRKNQIKYFIFSTSLLFTGMSLFFLPSFKSDWYPWGNFAAAIYPAIMGYAIIRYRLMDINLIFRDTTAYLLSTLLITVVFAFIGYLYNFQPLVVILLLALLGLIFPILHPYLKNKLLPVVEKTFFRDRYSYLKNAEKYRNFFRETSVTVRDVAENLVDSATKIFAPKNCNLLVYKFEDKTYRIKFQSETGNPLTENSAQLNEESPLLRTLDELKRTLVKEELEKWLSFFEYDIIREDMDLLKAEISAPLFMLGKIIGILNLGPKQNKMMYNHEDIRNLEALCRVAEEVLKAAIISEQESILTAGMTHDLRTPFSNIYSFYLQPLAAEELGPLNGEQKEAIELIHKELEKHNQRLDLTLDRTTLVYKRLYPEDFAYPFDLSEIIRYTMKLYTKESNRKHLLMEIKLPPALPLIYADPDDIELGVLQNLINNALRHTQEGKIVVSAEVKNNELLVTVSDTGSGIEPDYLAKIFDPFQLDQATKGEKGLGLYRVKDIITTYRGKVWIESTLGKGTTFYFTLPLATEEQIQKHKIIHKQMG